jgi:hypothetical protein
MPQSSKPLLLSIAHAASFAPTSNTRLAVLGILGMANAVANRYRSEEVAIDRVSAEFVRMIADGVMKRPKPRSHARRVPRPAR